MFLVAANSCSDTAFVQTLHHSVEITPGSSTVYFQQIASSGTKHDSSEGIAEEQCYNQKGHQHTVNICPDLACCWMWRGWAFPN
jgi:hypothetical protein